MIERKLVLTRYQDKILSAFIENSTVAELRFSTGPLGGFLGNIYVGRVKDVLKDIGGAFVEIAPGFVCYYSLKEAESACFVKKGGKSALAPGDLIVVQVSREAIKKKAPSVTTNLNISGRFLAISYSDRRVGVSSKIENSRKEELRDIIKRNNDSEYGFVARTNASEASEKELTAEIRALSDDMRQILAIASKSSAFTLLWETTPDYLTSVRDIYEEGLTEIVTDQNDLWEGLNAYLHVKMPKYLEIARFYDRSTLSLSALYNLAGAIDSIFKKTVWLKSGAYLVIERTETLTVIDVNSGKANARRDRKDFFLRVNLEAAEECARQIRLRNLTGMILIDFINLKNNEEIRQVLDRLDQLLKADPTKAELVDITGLQLVEITRRKLRKPVEEYFKPQTNIARI